MKKKTKKRLLIPLVSIFAVLCVIFAILDYSEMTSLNRMFGIFGINYKSAVSSADTLSVSIIDVGQADCILLTLNDKSMLIDAGNNDDYNIIHKYLEQQNVKKIDFLIGTHPHEDHIGSLDTVIKNYDIGKIYLPKVKDSIIPTTKTYEDLLNAIKSKGYKAEAAKSGKNFEFSTASVDIIAPVEEYSDLNNYSVVLKVSYGNTVFLFMGDAEEKSEKDIIKSGVDLKADFIKLGHHGSNTSSSAAFLRAVSPKFAAISCGKNNTYGHPAKKILDKLDEQSIPYRRTDVDGTLKYVSDGVTVSIVKEK